MPEKYSNEGEEGLGKGEVQRTEIGACNHTGIHARIQVKTIVNKGLTWQLYSAAWMTLAAQKEHRLLLVRSISSVLDAKIAVV